MNQETEPPSASAKSTSSDSASLASVDKTSDEESVIRAAMNWLRDKTGNKPSESSLKEVLEEVLDEDGQDALQISDEEKNLLKNIAEFGAITVGDIMIPRAEIIGVDKTMREESLITYIADIELTRIPVYDQSLDKVEGFLHVKDVFSAMARQQPLEVGSIMRNILFVPPSMRIVDLLLQMRVSGCHMAIVVDEYGGTDGLVTLEDLIEELVGEIQDEHDNEENEIRIQWLSETVLEVDARTDIETLEEELGLRITEGDVNDLDFETIGGLIFAHLGRVPVKGEVLKVAGLKIEVLQADPRRIRRVRIVKKRAK